MTLILCPTLELRQGRYWVWWWLKLACGSGEPQHVDRKVGELQALGSPFLRCSKVQVRNPCFSSPIKSWHILLGADWNLPPPQSLNYYILGIPASVFEALLILKLEQTIVTKDDKLQPEQMNLDKSHFVNFAMMNAYILP